jgi:hypothetical protein
MNSNDYPAVEVVNDPHGKKGRCVIAKELIPKGNQFSLSIKSNSDQNAG